MRYTLAFLWLQLLTIDAAEPSYTTTETFDNVEMQIKWIPFLSCNEGPNRWTWNADYDALEDLLVKAQDAVTVKILPSTDVPGSSETAEFAVMAELCSDPVHSLNSGYTISYTVDESGNSIGMEDGSNWIGSTGAVKRLKTSCGSTEKIDDFFGSFYCACNNQAGLYSICVLAVLCEL